MAISYWVSCYHPDEKGLFSGAKVHLSDCVSCSFALCSAKGYLFEAYFSRWLFLEETPLNRKLVVLNQKLQRRKVPASRRYCPLKTVPTERCHGTKRFCKYNIVCEKYNKRTGQEFIRALRWRKVMIYLVQMKDGSSSVVEKKDFGTINIDGVEKVYTANYEVRVVTELVPAGEEAQQFSEVIASFEEKYHGDIVLSDGMHPFTEWFSSAATGEIAYIPEKVLVPVKTYKVMRIKNSTDLAQPTPVAVLAKKVEAPKAEKEVKSTVQPPKKAKKQKTEKGQAGLFDDKEAATPKKKAKKKK